MSRIRRIRPRAVADLTEIYDYLADRNPDAADRFADATANDFDTLAQMPGLGAPYRTRNTSLLGLRVRPVTGFRNYLIFYLPVGNGIEVVRVYHGARNVRRLLRDE